ncbi:glycosyltransferase family 25 protein [Sphingomonas sp. BT-65]|uniref:glycosyltransferase family 25 protein n=1 Tax=Sphingomonas sp. BT-65 TaxID=2989821 RepID=UPI00223571E0|nr:glycosyltransferase family 25 protein [Sphingomonas sp. BT-65]MCW4461911.1 glycosyltransferase family 25 protein [Sphingomonas sp. BT-65]
MLQPRDEPIVMPSAPARAPAPDEPLTEVIVISLATADARRAAFAAGAAGASLSWRFLDACTARPEWLAIDEAAVLRNKGRALTRGEIGCYASHYSIWREMIDRGTPQAIVLEDDVVADWAYLARLAATDLSSEGFDYLRLYAKRPTFQRVVRKDFLQHSRTVVEMIGPAYGTQGYAITLAGARVLADRLRVIERPVDDAMDRSWAHGLRNLALFPAPLFEAAVPSDIGADRFQPKVHPSFRSLRQRGWRQLERQRIRLLKLRRLLGR